MTDDSPTRLEIVVEDRRLDLGLQKQQVAERAGVTASYLRRVLNGKQALSADVQAGLERALQWPRGRLSGFRNPREPQAPLSPPAGSRYTQEEWDLLTDSERLLLAELQAKLDDQQQSSNTSDGVHPIERNRVRGA